MMHRLHFAIQFHLVVQGHAGIWRQEITPARELERIFVDEYHVADRIDDLEADIAVGFHRHPQLHERLDVVDIIG